MAITVSQVIVYWFIIILSLILFQIEIPELPQNYSNILDLMGSIGILSSSFLFCKKALE